MHSPSIPQHTPCNTSSIFTEKSGLRVSLALFLDRDDTIIYDDGYMSRPEQIRLLPGAAEALRSVARHARIYLYTNQSGIGRGYYTLADAEACNTRLIELLALPEPGFHGICIAPEAPDVPSRYRKPSPTYILETIQKDNLEPQSCWMIGDKKSDIESGVAAGIRSILVGRGNGNFRPDAIAYAKVNNIPAYRTLAEAIVAINHTSLQFSLNQG